MHKYKKNYGKFTFNAIFLVIGQRGLAVSSLNKNLSFLCQLRMIYVGYT